MPERNVWVPTCGERETPSPRAATPLAIPPRPTSWGDRGGEPSPGSYSPPPGNQRKDRSRGTAHPRLYARALSPPLPGWGDGESALGMRRRPDIICSFGIDAPASGGAVSSRAQRPIGAERDPAGVHAPTGQARMPAPIPEAVWCQGRAPEELPWNRVERISRRFPTSIASYGLSAAGHSPVFFPFESGKYCR